MNRNNRDVVGLICDTVNRAFAGDARLSSRFPSCPAPAGHSHRSLVSYVPGRSGRNHRPPIDTTKLARGLGKRCSVIVETGLGQTDHCSLDQQNLWRNVTGGYKARMTKIAVSG